MAPEWEAVEVELDEAAADRKKIRAYLQAVHRAAIEYSDRNKSRFPAHTEFLNGLVTEGFEEQRVEGAFESWRRGQLSSPVVARYQSQIPLLWESRPDELGYRLVLFVCGHRRRDERRGLREGDPLLHRQPVRRGALARGRVPSGRGSGRSAHPRLRRSPRRRG